MSIECKGPCVFLQPSTEPVLAEATLVCTSRTEVFVKRFFIHNSNSEPLAIYKTDPSTTVHVEDITDSTLAGNYYPEFPALTSHLAGIGSFLEITPTTTFIPALSRDQDDNLILLQIPMTFTAHIKGRYICDQCYVKSTVFVSKQDLVLHLIPHQLRHMVSNVDDIIESIQ